MSRGPAVCGIVAIGILITAAAALAAFADPADTALAAIAAELHAPAAYVEAVLGPSPSVLGAVP